MLRFLLHRLLWALPVILAIVIINFIITRLAPGDPLTALIGEYPAPPNYVEQLRRVLGLDRPIHEQLVLYLLRVVQGDLGFSFANNQAVVDLVTGKALNTLALMIPALVLASIIGIVIGKLSANSTSRVFDDCLTAISLFGYSVPVFWFGQVLIIVFAVWLNWLPAQGMSSLRSELPAALDFLRHWILPGFTVTIFYAAVVARVARASLKQSMTGDYVTTALAKGVSPRQVFWRHILPNALIPIVSVIGYNFGYALTGAILVESVFAWPGLGNLFMVSIINRDYPVLQGIFIFAGTVVVLANLTTDALYGLIDPRIRHGARSS